MGIAATHGRAAEALAVAYLELTGLRVLERNLRLGGVEVDVLAAEGRDHVVVEVKYRTRADYGGSAAAVDSAKRARLLRAAAALVARRTRGRADRRGGDRACPRTAWTCAIIAGPWKPDGEGHPHRAAAHLHPPHARMAHAAARAASLVAPASPGRFRRGAVPGGRSGHGGGARARRTREPERASADRDPPRHGGRGTQDRRAVTGCGNLRDPAPAPRCARWTRSCSRRVSIAATYAASYNAMAARAPRAVGRALPLLGEWRPSTSGTAPMRLAGRSPEPAAAGAGGGARASRRDRVHALPAGRGALAAPRRGRCAVPLFCVITDFTAHPIWVFPHVDRYFVASDEVGDRAGRPRRAARAHRGDGHSGRSALRRARSGVPRHGDGSDSTRGSARGAASWGRQRRRSARPS